MSHAIKKFEGKIRIVSSSPHGEPEGIVLADGSFVKIPPHSLLLKNKIQEGAWVVGEGELIASVPNKVYYHVEISIGDDVVAKDNGKHRDRESLKEKHKKELQKMKNTPAALSHLKVSGKLQAIGLKPKGEVNRLILEDGTSVHVPKEIELDIDDLHLGAKIKVEGEGQNFAGRRFMKAAKIKTLPAEHRT